MGIQWLRNTCNCHKNIIKTGLTNYNKYLKMMQKVKRALISVSDKSNLAEIVNYLVKNNIEIISTGGTYKKIKKNILIMLLKYQNIQAFQK